MRLTKKQMAELVSTQARVNSSMPDITKEYGFYPYFDADTNEHKLAAVIAMSHDKSRMPNTHTTVLATTGKNEWYVWCGDEILDGTIEESDFNKRVVESVKSLPEANQEKYKEKMQVLLGSEVETASCKNKFFMQNLKSKLSKGDSIEDISNSGATIVCNHIKNMFAQMDDIEQEMKELNKMLKEANRVSKGTSDNQIVDSLGKYAFQGEATFIAGPGGHGKTHTVKTFASQEKLEFVELQGHGQIEAIDMYGYDKKVGDQMVWFDGPVSQAARLAASGKKTLLFIDEFVNIPMRETAGLKAAFEPYKGHYHFQTSRVSSVVDGIAVMEEIKVPVENLQIVAAANIGSGYASEDVDKALKQRFMFLYYEAEDEKVHSVLTSICDEKGFNRSLADKLMQFKKLLEIRVEEGELEEAPTMRHLSRKFLGLMKSEDELEDVAMDQILQFVEFDVDGKPVAEQMEIVEEAIEATLAA